MRLSTRHAAVMQREKVIFSPRKISSGPGSIRIMLANKGLYGRLAFGRAARRAKARRASFHKIYKPISRNLPTRRTSSQCTTLRAAASAGAFQEMRRTL
jgi:hypothetical protein